MTALASVLPRKGCKMRPWVLRKPDENVNELSIRRKQRVCACQFLRCMLTQCVNLPGNTVVPRFLFQKRYANGKACQLPMSVTLIVGRRQMTIEWAIGQYNVNIQRFEHDIVSIRSTWQCRHGAWLIDTPPRMVSLRLTPRSATWL